MNLLRTNNGSLINVSHAFEFHYDEGKSQLCVWWSFTVPNDSGAKIASMYDTERLTYHSVEKADWLRFLEKNR